MRTILFALILLPIFALANANAAPETYACRVLLVNSAAPSGEWTFKAERANGGHGGPEQSFKSGNETVVVLANGTWLGLSWFRGDEKIAEGLFVMGQSDTAKNRVAILYDPKSDAQVSIGCDRE